MADKSNTKLGNGHSSETEKLLPNNSNKDQAQQRSQIALTKQGKKNNKNCIMLMIVLIVALIIILSIIAISLLVSSYRDQSGLTIFSSSLKLGDYYSQSATSLITIDHEAHLLTISLLQPKEELRAYVYTSSTRPLLSSEFQLQEIIIPFLEGDGRYNYNYYGGDEGIYLNPGSSISYALDVVYNGDSNDSSLCPYRLFLFNDFRSYNSFRNREAFKSVDVTPCTPLKDEIKNMKFTIGDASIYYVGIEIDTDYLVTSNVSVSGTNYNTSKMSQPSNCDKPLTFINPSCNFTLCSSFYCDRPSDTYLAVEVNTLADFTYSYQASDIIGKSGLAEFTISCFLFVTIGIIVIVMGALAIYFLHQRRTRMKPTA